MTVMLTEHLDLQARENERERPRFNGKLAALEEENMQLFVHSTLLEDQSARLAELLFEPDTAAGTGRLFAPTGPPSGERAPALADRVLTPDGRAAAVFVDLSSNR
jgi:hypothetical protein